MIHLRPQTYLSFLRTILLVVLYYSLVGHAAESQVEDLLLKDYRPQSLYRIPKSDIKRARYPVIDMHSHAYAKTAPQIAAWVRTMDEAGIAKSIILTGATGQAFDDLYRHYSQYPDRFELWCGLDYTGYDQPGFAVKAVKELERCYRVGARGVGELGDKGKGLFYSRPTKAWGMHLDDPRLDPVLQRCAELDMPVNIHVADPYWMYEPMDASNDGLMNAYKWRLDNQPEAVGHAGMIAILERTVKRHPATTFIACHFANCSHNLQQLGTLLDCYPNLYADISARYAETTPIPRFTAQFYQRYQNRLVYGTDMGRSLDMYRLTFRILESADEHFYAWQQFSYHWPLHGLALPDKVLQKVYRTNAQGLIASEKAKAASAASSASQDPSPRPDEEQLPLAMHSAMSQKPQIHVGQRSGDFVGQDNRILQAGVDYLNALGGGTLHIGPGVYEMWDSLHLRPHVTVKGTAGQTILRKADAATSLLALDGDFGEEQITAQDPAGFRIGAGVTIWDDRAGGFHTTVARITGRRGSTFSINKPLMADCMVHRQAKAATVFPVISGYDIQGAVVEDLIVEGNKGGNPHLNGCRGAGIFLYRGFGTQIRNCVVRDYNGDGISFQQSNDVKVINCLCEGNTSLGLHPGSGSQRPTIKNNIARNNAQDGLFLCWRVRHGLFEDNILEDNGRFGISIGHKDSDNLLQRNVIRRNGRSGVFFRNETLGMAAHRNRLLNNVIENNGTRTPSPGIHIRGETNDLVFRNNVIRDTRPQAQATQPIGIQIDPQVGKVTLTDNTIQCSNPIVDKRPKP